MWHMVSPEPPRKPLRTRGVAARHGLCMAVVALLITGCAAPAHRVRPFTEQLADRDPAVARCAKLIAAVDDAIDRAHVRDGAAYRIPGYPFWRSDRLLASARTLVSPDDLRRWLRSHDREARTFELENLPPAALRRLVDAHSTSASTDQFDEEVNQCADMLSGKQTALPPSVAVPDDYQTWKRVLGVYALARIPFSSGVRGYQRDTERVFATPLEKLPVAGDLKRVYPALELGDGAASIDGRVRALFARHAPILEIDTVSADDRIGTVVYGEKGQAAVDTSAPTAYVRGAHAIVGGNVLTQLVYSFWFPTRPKRGALDLLGGHMDGITWRVTLAPNGDALVYDTMHNCGCYHQFFPTPALKAKPKPNSLDEWAFIPQEVPLIEPSQRVVVRIASGTHYVQRVIVAEHSTSSERSYAFIHDDVLRSLPLKEGGRRSLFGSDGIVRGSERGERYLFWPMGVREPGAMRQWGRHATAFIGRRHFDDPLLLDQYFVIDASAPSATSRSPVTYDRDNASVLPQHTVQ